MHDQKGRSISPPPDAALITVTEAARRFVVSATRLKAWIRTGYLGTLKRDDQVLLHPAAVAAVVQNQGRCQNHGRGRRS